MTVLFFFAKKMLNLSNVKIEKDLQGKVFFKLGNYASKNNQKDSAYFYYSKSKNFFLDKKDSTRIGRNLINLAIIESDYGSYTASDSLLVQSLKYIKKEDYNSRASAYNCLAINSKKQFLYNDAITNYNKAIEISKRPSSKIIYKSNIGNVYKELKDYSKAISILENLLKDSIANQKTKARIIDNLAHIKWLQNPKTNVLKDLIKSKIGKEKIKDNFGLIASFSHLSEYFENKNKTQSLFYANKMYQTAKGQNATNGQLEAIDKIVNLETPRKSIKYYKESIHLRDSLQETNTKRQYKFAKIKYNYEEEEKQKLKFKTLAAENELIAEKENNQKKNIGIFAALSTLGFLFFIYRRKQQHKKRVLQETYITETRIAKKLHDELGNDVYNLLTKVQKPNFEATEIVDDLDKIYLQTRAISHENDIIETGDKFEDFFRSLVANYNSDECKITLKDLNLVKLNSISDEKQIVVYRVFNELFVNMKKHSKASLVLISCKKINNQIEMMYFDNGIGFKENTIVFKNGLKNMETRIKKIKGTISFENKSENGLKVIFHFKK